ncbi:MAG: phage baseplate assembly protein V [Pirellulales bacterium]
MSLFEVETFELGSKRKFYGKYRGTVANNIDPRGMARLIANVPDVSSVALTSWAMPSLPWCGPQMGMVCVPPIGAGVWIEFEHGDQDYPIWSGCYWGSPAEVPSSATVPALGVTFQTLGQNVLQLSELGIKLQTRIATVEVRDDQILISHGPLAKITVSKSTVDINSGALQVE